MNNELVLRAQEGDTDAFEAIAASSHQRLYRVAIGILRDPQQAEDATQKSLIEIWKYLRRLRDPAAFESWSYRLLVRACVSEAKSQPRWVASDVIADSRQPRLADPFVSVVDRDQLERGFRRLSVQHRAVIVMRYLLDMPLEEVAETLDIPVGTVASRLSRAMAAMRAVLEADDRPATNPTPIRATER